MRRWVANLATLMVTLVLLALLWLVGEMLVRWRHPRWLGAADDMGYLHVYSERYGWEPKKGFALTLGPTTTINAQGTRGRPHEGPPAPGRTRVVVLGDSIAFGYGVADDETFSARLEAMDPSLEVVNLAVQGYGTDQELLKLEDQGFAYQPRVVILNFCLANDFRDNGSDRSINDPAYRKPYFTLEGERLVLHDDHVRLSLVERAGLFLNRRSALFNWLRGRAQAPAPDAAEAAPDTADTPPARDVTRALLRRVAEVTRARGVRLLVVVYPNYREFLRPTARTRLLLDDPGLGDALRLDLLPELQARGFDRDHYDEYALDGYLHLKPKGHALVAQVLHETLATAGVLAGSGGGPERQ